MRNLLPGSAARFAAAAMVMGIVGAMASGQTPQLLKNLNPTAANPAGASNPIGFVQAGGFSYFFATDPTNGSELWKTDGTADGTVLVKDINPGAGGSQLNFQITGQPVTPAVGMIAMGSTLFFWCNDGTHSAELYKTDGTAAGTVMVKDVNPAGQGGVFFTDNFDTIYPPMAVVGNKVFFVANNGATANGTELWVSDGTTAGTVMVKDINATAAGAASNPYGLTAFGDRLFFFATNGIDGFEAWVSDGTEAGTTMIANFNPTAAAAGIVTFKPIVMNGVMYYCGDDGAVAGATQNLIRWDGVNPPAIVYRNDPPAVAVPFIRTGMDFVVYNDRLYFRGNDGTNGSELWVSDGTTAGTHMVQDTVLGAGLGLTPTRGVVAGNKLFFAGTGNGIATGAGDWEVYATDGTDVGTVKVIDLNAGLSAGYLNVPTTLSTVAATANTPLNGVAYDGKYYFAGTTVGTFSATGVATGANIELFVTDGTVAGTGMVKEIHATASSLPRFLKEINGRLIFAATEPVGGREPWVSDGTSAGTVQLKDINSTLGGSNADYFTEVPGVGVFFTANDSVTGYELHKTDGTTAGTVQVKDINNAAEGGVNGGLGSNPTFLTPVGDKLFFAATNRGPGTAANQGFELWMTDGTTPGTKMVMDINPGSGNGVNHFNAVNQAILNSRVGRDQGTTFVELNGKYIFVGTNGAGTINDPASGRELYISGGGPNTFIANGNFDTLALGTVPDAGVAAGAWGFPANYVANAVAEPGVSTEIFTIASNPTGGAGNALRLSGAALAASDAWHVTNLFTQPITAGPGVIVTVSFDIFVGLVGGGGTVYVGGDNGGGGYSNVADRSAQVAWLEDGTIVAVDGTGANNPLLVGYPRGSFQQVRMVIDTSAHTFNLFHNGTQIGTNLAFRAANPAQVVNYDRVSAAIFGSEMTSVDSHIDNVVVSCIPIGTGLLKDINPGAASSLGWLSTDAATYVNPLPFWKIGNFVYFTAADGTTGLDQDPRNSGGGGELWRTDGTRAGTIAMSSLDILQSGDIAPGAGGSDPHDVTPITNANYPAGSFLFYANDGGTGDELWSYTEGGFDGGGFTQYFKQVKDINTTGLASGSWGTWKPVVINGVMYFAANDGVNGREVWRSDGTDAGTFMIGDIFPGPTSSFPGPFFALGNLLLFNADNGDTGFEYFVFDTTQPAGPDNPHLLADLYPGPTSGASEDGAVWNGRLYIAAGTPATGFELYSTDGVSAPILVADLNVGSKSSSPNGFLSTLNSLYFVANDGVSGVEPYVMHACSAPSFSTSPGNADQCLDSTVNLHAVAEGTTPVISWKRDGNPVVDGVTAHGSTITGATTGDLTITNAKAEDSGVYIAYANNACGVDVPSSPATVAVHACACNLADIVGPAGVPPPDGRLGGEDFLAFMGAFAGGGLLADVVGPAGVPPPDGQLGGEDFLQFLAAFTGGC